MTTTPKYFSGEHVASSTLTEHPAETFSALVRSLVTAPQKLPVTAKAYHEMKHSQQSEIKKRLSYLTPCTFPDSPWVGRLQKHAKECHLLFLDIDDNQDAARLIEAPGLLTSPGLNLLAYRTTSHTAEKPRMRVMVEAQDIPPSDYPAAVQSFAKLIGLGNINSESKTVSQPMFLPSVFEGDTQSPVILELLKGRAFTIADIGESLAAHSVSNCVSDRKDDSVSDLEFLKAPVSGVTAERAKEILAVLNPDMPRAEWLKVGMALKHQFGGTETGYQLFDEWSARATTKYEGPDTTLKAWDSFKPHASNRASMTFRTLVQWARDEGWTDKGTLREPLPLPNALPSVPAFDSASLLPLSLRGYVQDCAERLQVDPAFVAVPLMVSLGAVLGNRLGLRPKVYDDYTEFANIWGAIMGRPATLKSPSLSASLRFIEKLERTANEAHQECRTEWKREQGAAKIRRQAAAELAKKAAKAGKDFDPASLMLDEEEETGPPLRRFTCNDASPESLHCILSRPENATGVLLFTDELSGLIARMNDPERGAALRSFLLSGWNGYQPAVVDRIGRGENLRVDRCCISVLGGIQPGKLAPLVDAAVKESAQDDGWLQRFSLLVYPDAPEHFRCIDRAPNSAAYAEVMGIFERVESTTGEQWPGAERDPQRGSWFIRFEPMAAAHFNEWIETETKALRAGDLGAAVESHFLKYRKAVCALTLLFHVATEPDQPAVSLACLMRALAWLEYLKPHALRVYGSRRNDTAKAAARILERLRKRDLPDRFTVHQLKRPCWSGLTDGETINAALAMLVDHGWLSDSEIETGGRPRVEFTVHSKVFQVSESLPVKTVKSPLSAVLTGVFSKTNTEEDWV